MGRETGISTHSNTNMECQHMTIYCRFCSRVAKNNNSNSQHELRCKFNPNKLKNSEKSEKWKLAMASRKGNCENQFTRAKRLGLPMPKATNRYIKAKELGLECVPHKHSEETKQKISKIRIKYLEENPDKVPYKLNHYSKGRSYPENYWKSILDAHKLVYKEQYQIYLYQLDFAFVDSKIDLEIDGEQHYLDERISLSDQRRNEYLENLGWKIIRIRWSEFQKNKDKEAFVHTIIEQIKSTCIPSGYEPVERLTG
jgi:very-short-patch-repair endonuclease